MKRVSTIILLTIIMPVIASVRTLRVDSNQRISKDALKGYTLTELMILRNSIFANYGYEFKSTALNEYFLSLSWYKPNKNFSFDMLTAIDRKNVQLIRSIERERIARQKEALVTIRCKKTKYFMEMRITRSIPHTTQRAIMDYLHVQKMNDQIPIPNFTKITLLQEKSQTTMTSIIENAIENDKTAAYRIAHFDNNGILRILQSCYADAISGKICTLRYYFDQYGKITLIRGSVSQTTIEYEWYFSYLRDEVVSMTLTVRSHSNPDKKVTKIFYP